MNKNPSTIQGRTDPPAEHTPIAEDRNLTETPAPQNGCLHELVEAQVARTPDALAVVFDGRQLTYRQLNERANQLAHHLRKLGVGPKTFVGLFVERSLEMVAGLLGILKAGGAYVPMDPQYPRERLAFIMKDAGVPVVVTQKDHADHRLFPNLKLVCLDSDWPEIAREPVTNPQSDSRPDQIAYIIYTSGSTGTPKGSLISHDNVRRLFTSTERWFHFNTSDVWTLFHSIAFDFSVWEVWGALFYGGRLVVVPFSTSRTPAAFHRLLHAEGVTVLNQTPSAFRQLVRAEELTSEPLKLVLRLVIFGGEALDFKTLKPWFDRHGDAVPRLVNMYGITETTVHVTYRPIDASDLGGSSVIGVPIPDLQVYLLDDQKRPVPTGEPGEICVGGAGVGSGYLNRPELTAQKFIPDPFAPEPGRRLYCSGDLGRRLPNGDLEYLGRIDHQVKISGYRIELGEIEAVINQHPGVRESVVIAREDVPGEKTLAAYLIKRPHPEVSVPALRQMIRERLPEYMMPAAFEFISQLPLTVNGKLDTMALPVPGPAAIEARTESITPQTALEQDIAKVWQEVLKQPVSGVDDNFFDIGGNSIRLAGVHAQLEKLLGRDILITDLFAHTTIRSLAAHFGRLGGRTGGLIDATQSRAQKQRQALLGQRTRNRPLRKPGQ